VQRPTPELEVGIQRLSRELGKLLGLKEMNVGSPRLSGNLRQILCELQAPLESLELALCSLLPTNFSFL
ncbi:LRC14 protein, partial [Calyptomena viridis]|nr:LRC14 protein [Calyptomena viridis]